MAKIFISYRREDAQYQADHLHRLMQPWVANPREDIFIDVDNIPLGVDFEQHLKGKVAQCDILLAVIGGNWLNCQDAKTGQRRLDDPADFVRIEISTALERGIPVVPVLLDGAPVPSADHLPENLKLLSKRNGTPVNRLSFEADVERLMEGLGIERPTKGIFVTQKPKPKVESRSAAPIVNPYRRERPPAAVSGRMAVLIALGVVIVSAAGAGVYFIDPVGMFGNAPARTDQQVEEQSDIPAAPSLLEVVSEQDAPGAAGFAQTVADPGTAVPPPGNSEVPATRVTQIKEIQAGLKVLGYYASSVDGTAGAATQSAADAFARVAGREELVLASVAIDNLAVFRAEVTSAAKEYSQRDAAAWKITQRTDTSAAYQAYLEDFPKGTNASAARTRISTLSTPPKTAGPIAVPRVGEEFSDSFKSGSGRGPQMVVLPSGRFTMGSPAGEEGRKDNEGPQRTVRINYHFAVGKHEVTWTEYSACVSDGGCAAARDDGFGKGSRPVTNVSWEDSKKYASWLSGKTGQGYRLLTEAEWEYAARAGTAKPFSFGATISTDQANYFGPYTYGSGVEGEYREKTTPAGSFPANAFGLFDMHGNVSEWTEDCYEAGYSAQPDDGSAYTVQGCSERVVRGGSWGDDPLNLRLAERGRSTPGIRNYYLGFRLAKTLR
ncbi:SUMF1/EgtB/PvdO family nonheme iron enzyme [Hyphomonas sp.]|uniref:SUMF1/EgtB/PvdO family nonheme iron enzyme n=1 Tax=Hyphomonas sp. TaxID=87 RepID=UPI0025B90012|nr:SUMF1/EgtB/PvdO family nonheme iron enzyme [Hyphomonas sp.]